MCWWGFKVFLRVFGNLASRILADTLDASYKMCTTLCPCGCSNTANSAVISVQPHQQHMSDDSETGEFLIYYLSAARNNNGVIFLRYGYNKRARDAILPLWTLPAFNVLFKRVSIDYRWHVPYTVKKIPINLQLHFREVISVIVYAFMSLSTWNNNTITTTY